MVKTARKVRAKTGSKRIKLLTEERGQTLCLQCFKRCGRGFFGGGFFLGFLVGWWGVFFCFLGVVLCLFVFVFWRVRWGFCSFAVVT